ncbi:MAG: putative quinol monooxygenase [Macellibacteroides sp.]|uniref:putative quinol monooxygenase n=1 Tax=Macellibacteroides sp. TaxID=2014584 RepID=UPI003E75CFF2
MIRLNVVFTLKGNVNPKDVLEITNELVAKSRQDEGNISYDLYQSSTDPKVMLFVETWENQEVLDKHSAASHFISAVPKISALTVDGLKIDRFEF